MKTEMPADATSTFSAEAISGAGSPKVGIAGSLGVNLVDNTSESFIASGAQVLVNGGDMTVSAANQSSNTAKALPNGDGASGGTKGIGASVAVNDVDNLTRAEVERNVTPVQILGDQRQQPDDCRGRQSYQRDRSQGRRAAAKGEDGKFAITPVVAITVVENTTTARFAMSPSRAMPPCGESRCPTTTKAEGNADANATAAGIAAAFSSVQDEHGDAGRRGSRRRRRHGVGSEPGLAYAEAKAAAGRKEAKRGRRGCRLLSGTSRHTRTRSATRPIPTRLVQRRQMAHSSPALAVNLACSNTQAAIVTGVW